MPKQERIKTKYPGVTFIDSVGAGGPERVFYIRYRREGKVIEEKAGRQYADDMTEAKANAVRTDRIRGKELSNEQRRQAAKVVKERWTIEKLWTSYKTNHLSIKGLAQDECRFKKHIEPSLGKKEPSVLVPLDVDRIRIKLLKTMKPATVRNVLELLRRIINYAGKKQICATPLFKIEMPVVDNLRTEDLNEDQMGKLLRILREGIIAEPDGTQTPVDPDARDAMLLALCSAMRRGEIFKLMWDDIDFQRGFITIRGPKGGKTQTIPLSSAAKEILENRTRTENSPFVFPGRGARQPAPGKPAVHRADASKHLRAIRDAAGLPKDFRPMHGLRHAFASRLASSGEVDLYTIQRLLTHKSPLMTQRYAHLRDETLRKASTLAGNIIEQAAQEKEQNGEVATA